MLFADVFTDGFVKFILALGLVLWFVSRAFKAIDPDGQVGTAARESLIKKINKWWS